MFALTVQFMDPVVEPYENVHNFRLFFR